MSLSSQETEKTDILQGWFWRQQADWSREPSAREVLLLAFITTATFFCVVCTVTSYPSLIDNFGDSSAYMSIASAIRRWNFQDVLVKQFWGLPYAMAATSWLTRVSDRTALLIVSFTSSIVTVIFAWRLWGGWVAGFFAIMNFDWMQRSALGGSEPLFMALLLGSFLAVRRERWLWASALAALATVVRPLGIFALVGIALALLLQGRYRTLITATLIGLVVGVLYAFPLLRLFGDPLATVHSYQGSGQSDPWLFGLPFYAIVKGTILYPAPFTNLILAFGWIGFVSAGVVVMAKSARFHAYAKTHVVEVAFAIPYLLLICSYNSPYWARGSFPRFAIPVIPFVLISLDRWLPKDRRLLWTAAIVSGGLGAVSALGVANIVALVHRG